MRKHLRTIQGFLVAGLLLSSSVASPCGAYTHIHISQLALALLPAGPLAELLASDVELCDAGSMFPDSGYAISDDYGEQAHWPEFHNAWLNSLHEMDLSSPDVQSQATFLLGARSHGLADHVCDTT